MDSLIHDDKGTTISNDGATISNDDTTIKHLLDIMQPGAKILIDVAKSQDSKVPAQKSMGARDKRSIILSLSYSEAEDNDRTKNKEPPSVDLVPSISHHQETSHGTYSDDETIGSLLR
ncbi:hypothetical protein ZWY2020_016876 [Hordeum vulgare]|nr:hypothetical protein ZWY2020_016876 [Hordeum vulgare]